jgi:segregation and condensation protein A
MGNPRVGSFKPVAMIRWRGIRRRALLGQAHPVVAIEGFSGPFDLLLRLIERKELDILAISLFEVTEQYLQILTDASLRDPEHLSAFLVVAAKLLLIKSMLLLPGRSRPAATTEVELDPTDLTERLRRYQQFRVVANFLGERHDSGLRGYPRPPAEYRPERARPTVQLPAVLLAEAFRAALARPKAEAQTTLPADPRLTLADALAAVRVALNQFASIKFEWLIGPEATKQRYVATFLAVLELIRLGVATAAQNDRFGDITLTRLPSMPTSNGEAVPETHHPVEKPARLG